MADNIKTVVVGILNLQVILSHEGSSWVAQAIDIDYAAGGASEDDAKKRFETGLCETIQTHFQLFGNADRLLDSKAPASDWLELLREKSLNYSQVSRHKFTPPDGKAFPYGQITYLGATHQPALQEA